MFGNRFRLMSAVAVGAVAAATLMGPPAQAATSTVTGSVSSATGAVGKASLSFYASCQDFTDFKPAGSASVMGGAYTLTIPDGTYLVHIRPESPGDGIVASWHNAEPTCEQATPATISGDGTRDLVALAGSLVTGTVRFNALEGPDPINSASFYATCQDYLDGKTAPSTFWQGPVGTGGFLARVPDGSYRVLIGWGNPNEESWHNAAATCEQATPVTVSGDTPLDLTIRRGSVVTGAVSTSHGSVTVGGVSFYATCQDYQDGRVAASSLLNTSGYTVTVPKGTYRVLIWPDDGTGAVESWHSAKGSCEDATTVTIDGDMSLDLVALPVSVVTGTVSSSKGPVEGGTIEFFASCADYAWHEPAGSGSWSGGGSYTVAVPAGTYRVWIGPDDGTGAAESWHSAQSSCEQVTVVTIDGDMSLDLVALPVSVVTGTVSSSKGPVEGGEIEFYASCEHYAWEAPTGSGSWSGGGSYTVAVPAGTYRVLIWPDDGTGAVESWHSAQSSCEQATVVTIDGDMSLDLVALPVSVVTGTVSSSKGPVAGGTIELYASCDDYEYEEPEGSGSWSGGGSYAVTVPDGAYRVWIGPSNGTGAVESWHSAKGSCEQATTVTINGDTSLDLVALPGSGVTGTVSDRGGPLPIALVSFYPTCGDYEQDVDSGSSLVVGGAPYLLTVPDGTYRVQILTMDSNTGDIMEYWHSAAATCLQATAVTIAGDTTLNLVARAGPAPQPGPIPPTPAPPVTTPTPAPPTATPLGTQSVVKPPKKLNRGKKAKLARSTKQGSRLTWRTTTQKICRVTKFQVTGLKKGKCTVKASAPAVAGFAPLSTKFILRVR